MFQLVTYDLIVEDPHTCYTIPLTYFINREELEVNIFKLLIRMIRDFIGDDIYGYRNDFNRLTCSINSFNNEREYDSYCTIASINYSEYNENCLRYNVCFYKRFINEIGYTFDQFKKNILMELKLGDGNINVNVIEFALY